MTLFSSLSGKRPGATLAGIFSVALASVLLLCGAGLTPTGNVQKADINANGFSLTNAGTVSAGNLVATNLTGMDPHTINLTGQALVCEGDSQMSGGGVSPLSSTQTISYLLGQSPFFLHRATLYSVAVSGAMIPAGSNGGNNITDRYNTYVKPHRPAANGGDGGPQATLAIIAGINDVRTGVSSSTIISAYAAYTAQARSDGFKVIISTVMPYYPQLAGATELNRQTVNAAIRNGTIPADYVVDCAAYLPNDTDANFWQTDNLHPNPNGAAFIASRFLATLFAGNSLHGGSPGVFDTPIWTPGNGIEAGQGITNDAGAIKSPSFAFGGSGYTGPSTQQLESLYSTSFPASASGWWRVYSSGGSVAAGMMEVRDSSIPEDSFLSFHVFNGDITITQLGTGTDTSRMIDQVRVSTDGTSTALDVHLNTTRGGDTVTVNYWGPNGGNISVTPTGGASAYATSKTLTFSAAQGINTTGTIASNGSTLTLGGNLATSGSNALTLTTTGTTSLTLPTSGTLLATTGSGSALTGIPTSISNSDGTLTISPTTGAVVASLNPAHANTWTALQTIVEDGSGFALAFYAHNGTTVQGTVQNNTFSMANSSGTTTVQMAGSSTGGFLLSSGQEVSFDANATLSGSADIGFKRNAAGVLEINNGTAGTYRDLKLRSLLGTTTNDNGASGAVGEYVSSTVVSGSAISLTTDTPANVTSLSLTAGDWDVVGVVYFNQGASTTAAYYTGGIGTTSATLPGYAGAETSVPGTSATITGYTPSVNIARTRLSLSGTTTVYLVGQSGFATSTQAAYGFIGARRVR